MFTLPRRERRDQHPPPISLWPGNHLLAMPAPIDVEQGLHRLPSGDDQVPQAVAAHGPVAVAIRDVARARGDAPARLIEPDGQMLRPSGTVVVDNRQEARPIVEDQPPDGAVYPVRCGRVVILEHVRRDDSRDTLAVARRQSLRLGFG